MPKPMGVCIEDLEARPGEPRYVRCVAVPGRQPGLRLDTGGEVLWRNDEDVACELWVSADHRLILYRPGGAAAVTVSRAGRSLDVPYGKPVVLIDQDQVDVGVRRLRVHVHGEAPAVSAPSVLAPQQGTLAGLARAAAVAATIGAAAVAGGCGKNDADAKAKPPVEVRDQPPSMEAPPEKKPAEKKKEPDNAVAPDALSDDKIEVRTEPPTPPAPPSDERPGDRQTDKAEPPEPDPAENKEIEVREQPPAR